MDSEQWVAERWLTIPEYDKYEVSNLGHVRNKKTKRILRTSTNRPGGYHRVGLDGKKQYIHRLVAGTFYDYDIAGKDVNHRDGNKSNNTLPNLEICDRKDNIQHAYFSGLKNRGMLKLACCKYCKRRGDFAHCEDQPDDFFCKYGER